MNHIDEQKSSIAQARSIEQRRKKEQEKKKFLEKRGNQKIVWWCGLALSLAPILFAWLIKLTHLDDPSKVEICEKFVADFFCSGSFLWIAVTLLATSLLELLLNGFKSHISKEDKRDYNVFLIISALIMVIAIILFYDNIGSPINRKLMHVISVVAFILFAYSSRIVTYRLVKGA